MFKEFQPITLSGTINSSTAISIPAINPQKLYLNMLYLYAKKYNVTLNIPKEFQKVPQNSQELVCVTHSISDILKRVNSNSDNMKYVVLGFIVVLLLMVGSIIDSFKFIDIVYMGFVLFFLGRYIYIKKTEN